MEFSFCVELILAPDHFLNLAIAKAHSIPGSSRYAHRLSSAINVFSDLFLRANGRPHDPEWLFHLDAWLCYVSLLKVW